MDDAVFFSANLLAGEARHLVDSQPTQASKAKYFLDHMTKAVSVDLCW